ncbi:MAG TPA: hypothetical protein VHM23_29425, partial [Actinomycetota bacterium]|nr:hypothetical protein [Actinomycetota bacterium]
DPPTPATEDGSAERPRPPVRSLLLEGLLVYLAFGLLTVPFLAAIRARGETFFDDVLLGFFGPEKHGLAGLLRGGFLPTWLDNQDGGEPLLANRRPSRSATEPRPGSRSRPRPPPMGCWCWPTPGIPSGR